MSADGSRESVAVLLDEGTQPAAPQVGSMRRVSNPANDVISFSYETGWLNSAVAFQLDPALMLFEGEQYPQGLPGIFQDAAPDRWGRTLIERREAVFARRESRGPRTLNDWDYLLSVNDETRIGALRLRGEDGTFLATGNPSVPPVTRLRELEALAWQHERDEVASDPDDDHWLEMLLDPGSSLGGARPKANFAEADGSLWIAKFPSVNDRHDVGGWEQVMYRLAERAAIRVAPFKVLRLGERGHTFCVRRFDRQDGGRRLYGSAMTLTGRADHEPASYLDVVEAIETYGAAGSIAEDLAALFRRLVFNLLTANRDDHLRNLGFLRGPEGWRLSPAFDLNPSPEKHGHALAIDFSDNTPDLRLVEATASHYRLSAAEAERIIAEVSTAIEGWQALAQEARITAPGIARMDRAFRLPQV